MAKFCEYRDLFKWNKQLMEDDWNDGQTYVLKTVNKASDKTVSITNTKMSVKLILFDRVGVHINCKSR